ncbi:GerMN domain-containing protein [Aliterella atlantica]|uniref:Spore germination protein n=1 Tax=Aliterella atlantica CENA595 TaxID=1618023 RepID=A0A0D8ZXA4_9CYAN|nr:GerMN domain-containing protein [Aliterella atlantica]KJH73079.1 spore germination protein [Aliterella atlantica CENA595]
MTREQRVNRLPNGAIAAAIIAAVAAGGGAAWWGFHATNPPTNPSTTVPNVVQQPTPSQAAQSTTAQIYLLRDTGTNLELVPKPIEVNTKQPNAVLEAAFQGLLAGSADAKVSSTIPAGTKLRSLEVKEDGIHVDLSPEFTTGGGSASMSGRLAQVIYTATTLDANANVWIEVEGKPLEVLGGEGLEVSQPMTRQSFQENFTL